MNNCLINCDFHTHTGFSDDCDFPFYTMLDSAVSQGIEILAVTDHYDPGYPDPDFPFELDLEPYQKTLTEAAVKYEGRLDLRRGIEMGIMEGQLDVAEKTIDGYDYDFVIGSFHCMRHDALDLYDYAASDGALEIEDFYTYMLENLTKFRNFDILGHFSIIDRYIGQIYDMTPISDLIDQLLKLLIENGKGLEINTSSFHYKTGEWMPRASILRRYKELGGEILTFGSDAHDPKNYQQHFNEAIEFAASLGFRYYCTFKERQPDFQKLPVLR